jgi:hypothetical protein
VHAPRSRVDLAIAREAISSCATRGLTEKFVKGSAAYGTYRSAPAGAWSVLRLAPTHDHVPVRLVVAGGCESRRS